MNIMYFYYEYKVLSNNSSFVNWFESIMDYYLVICLINQMLAFTYTFISIYHISTVRSIEIDGIKLDMQKINDCLDN